MFIASRRVVLGARRVLKLPREHCMQYDICTTFNCLNMLLACFKFVVSYDPCLSLFDDYIYRLHQVLVGKQ